MPASRAYCSVSEIALYFLVISDSHFFHLALVVGERRNNSAHCVRRASRLDVPLVNVIKIFRALVRGEMCRHQRQSNCHQVDTPTPMGKLTMQLLHAPPFSRLVPSGRCAKREFQSFFAPRLYPSHVIRSRGMPRDCLSPRAPASRAVCTNTVLL